MNLRLNLPIEETGHSSNSEFTQLEDARERIKEFKERRSAAYDVMSRIDICSPVAGVVVCSKVSTIGAVIKAGDTIMELVPCNDRRIIEVRVRPQNIDNTIRPVKRHVFASLRSSNVRCQK